MVSLDFVKIVRNAKNNAFRSSKFVQKGRSWLKQKPQIACKADGQNVHRVMETKHKRN